MGQVVRSKREQLAYTEHDSVDLVIITAESTLIEQQVEWDEVRAAVWGGLLVFCFGGIVANCDLVPPCVGCAEDGQRADGTGSARCSGHVQAGVW